MGYFSAASKWMRLAFPLVTMAFLLDALSFANTAAFASDALALTILGFFFLLYAWFSVFVAVFVPDSGLKIFCPISATIHCFVAAVLVVVGAGLAHRCDYRFVNCGRVFAYHTALYVCAAFLSILAGVCCFLEWRSHRRTRQPQTQTQTSEPPPEEKA